MVLVLILMIVNIFQGREARGIACQDIGFDNNRGYDKCVNETDFIYVTFDCKGICDVECTAKRESGK